MPFFDNGGVSLRHKHTEVRPADRPVVVPVHEMGSALSRVEADEGAEAVSS